MFNLLDFAAKDLHTRNHIGAYSETKSCYLNIVSLDNLFNYINESLCNIAKTLIIFLIENQNVIV